MSRRGGGFTLIELMIVIAIIGILSSIALSAYQTYVIRTQVTEGISLAASAKVAVVDAYTTTGSPPDDRIEAGLSAAATDTRGSYVTQVEITDGRIDITFGNRAHQDIVGKVLSLTPYVNGSAVTWRCGHAPQPAGTIMQGPSAGDTAVYQPGDIDARYLPSTCR